MGIVHPDELAQSIIGVGGGQASLLLGDNIPKLIIFILEANTSSSRFRW